MKPVSSQEEINESRNHLHNDFICIVVGLVCFALKTSASENETELDKPVMCPHENKRQEFTLLFMATNPLVSVQTGGHFFSIYHECAFLVLHHHVNAPSLHY